jgi:hypothetical protein
VVFRSFARLFFNVFITRVTDRPISLRFPDLSWISLSLPNGLRGKMDLFLLTTIKSELKWLILNSLIDFFWWTKLRLSTLIDSFWNLLHATIQQALQLVSCHIWGSRNFHDYLACHRLPDLTSLWMWFGVEP